MIVVGDFLPVSGRKFACEESVDISNRVDRVEALQAGGPFLPKTNSVKGLNMAKLTPFQIAKTVSRTDFDFQNCSRST